MPAEDEAVTAEKRDPDYSRLGLKPDRSGYPVDRGRIITADRYIPAALEHRLNSQVKGRAILQVTHPVFGGDGFKVLLEAGTKIVCTYEPLKRQGDTRLPLNCVRLIRPDGASVVLKDMVTGDAMASAGAPGIVDNRIWDRYGAAMISASLGALASLGEAVSQSELAAGPAQAYGDAMKDATGQLLQQSMNLAPIVTIPAGTLMTLQPLNDIMIME